MFSKEWGLSFGGAGSGWQILSDQDTRAEILSRAGKVDLQPLRDKASGAHTTFFELKEAVSSILGTYLTLQSDSYIEDLKTKVDDTSVRSMQAYGRAYLPTGTIASRDSTAIDQGLSVAPHQQMLAEINGVLAPFSAAQILSGYAKNAADHLRRKPADPPLATMQQTGSRMFVGHGGSPQWRELKDYVQDSCGVPVDEFNRVPAAGFTTIARLNEMLDSAAMAFLVMTAEDEMADGSNVARGNVIHEVGLFQGRLGFEKAIVMLEEGCEEFSNIHGLIQVRYPKGNISAKFHEVRALLEREKLV
jgi:predicted nucleotide-binding protein